jgi:membrane protease YdiL (CAAX protease family)
VGIALWVVCGAAAFFIARIIPAGRNQRRAAELIAAVVTSFLFGVIATALDFGGWKELDWRCGLFVFFGAFAACGLVRIATMRR